MLAPSLFRPLARRIRLYLQPSIKMLSSSYATESTPSRPPPPIHPYKKSTADPKPPQPAASSIEAPIPEPQPKPEPVYEPPNPQRGREAMMRVVLEGKLDEKYKPAALRVTAIIVCLPIVIGVGYVLYERLFLGVEQKKRPVKKLKEQLEAEAEEEGKAHGTV